MSDAATPVDPRSSARRPTLRQAATVMAFVVGGLWAIEIIDLGTRGWLDNLGIHPRTPAGLLQIFTAPLLHYGFWHLLGNSLPLFVLGTVILMQGPRIFGIVTVTSVIASGLLVWLIAPSTSVTLGASGVVFGYLAYLLARGYFTRKPLDIAVALVVGVIYGGMLFGILPLRFGVSWQAHLGGALGGVAAAWLLHEQRKRTTNRADTP